MNYPPWTIRSVLISNWSALLFRGTVVLGQWLAWALILTGPIADGAVKPQWEAISPAELASKDSAANPGAGAEILFSREKLEEDEYGLVAQHYVRAKIYTQGGIDQSSLLRITFRGDATIKGLEARVVKTTGAIIDLTRADFHESTVVKEGRGQKLKQIAFAFPNLSPGDIVEYRWSEIEANWVTFWTYCQKEVPVLEYKFAMDSDNGAIISWKNCPQAEATGGGTNTPGVTIRNLPPFVTEDFMPPEHDCRGWIRLNYNSKDETPEKGWQDEGKSWASFFDDEIMSNRAITRKAGELISGATTNDDKLHRLYDYCQTELINYTWNDSPEVLREKEKLQKYGFKAARQTFDRRKGSSEEINYVFAALARAAGFEVKAARSSSRENALNIRMRAGWSLFDRSSIAVKADGNWRFFCPGDYFVPYGMLDRTTEGALAFLNDSKKSEFVTIPSSLPSLSTVRRQGHFRLDTEGVLEGEVEQELRGHPAAIQKENHWSKPIEEMEKQLRATIAQRLPTAEVTSIRWENLKARNLPVLVRYNIIVPGFAQRLGRRLAFATNFFETGSAAVFTTEQRHYPIVFPYAWNEHDEIELQIPEGYMLDQPSAPRNVGSPKDPIHCEFQVRFEKKSRTLVYQRDFCLGEEGRIAFSTDSYPWIKRAFNALHESEMHTLVLKPVPARESAP